MLLAYGPDHLGQYPSGYYVTPACLSPVDTVCLVTSGVVCSLIQNYGSGINKCSPRSISAGLSSY